jgi:hypothetical protein
VLWFAVHAHVAASTPPRATRQSFSTARHRLVGSTIVELLPFLNRRVRVPVIRGCQAAHIIRASAPQFGAAARNHGIAMEPASPFRGVTETTLLASVGGVTGRQCATREECDRTIGFENLPGYLHERHGPTSDLFRASSHSIRNIGGAHVNTMVI